jgi:hypothetical protein
VSFGDGDGIQGRVISAMVRRGLWLVGAALIARNPRIGGRRWGGRCAGVARRSLHGLHNASSGERAASDGVETSVGGKVDEMRRPFSVKTFPPALIGGSILR